jgi:hypothetical protein
MSCRRRGLFLDGKRRVSNIPLREGRSLVDGRVATIFYTRRIARSMRRDL